MRPPASKESSPQSPELSALRSPLSSALSSLNVYLEEELVRYRRQRQGRPVAASTHSKTINKSRRKPLDLISVKPDTVSPADASDSSQRPSSAAVTPPPPPPNPFLSSTASSNTASSDTASSNTASDRPDGAATSAVGNQAVEPAGQLAVATQTAADGDGVSSAVVTHVNRTVSPDNYLESSEELLKSLADGLTSEHETAQTSQRRFIWTSKLATPVSVGSFLLLLVTSAGLGYIVTNPSAINHLLRPADSDVSSAVQGLESTNSAVGLDRNGTFRPLGPDLSNQEFIDLNLDTLSTLPGNEAQLGPQLPPPTNSSSNTEVTPVTPPATEPKSAAATPNSVTSNPVSLSASSPPSVTPIPQSYSVPTAAAAPRPATSAAPTASPGPTPAAAPSVATSTPSVAATTVPSLPVIAPSPAITEPVAPVTAVAVTERAAPIIPRYRVVTPYTGDPSLNQVRGVVADAFVRESQIQAGAFADEAAAQARVQELQAQGIAAQVYAD